MEVQKLACHVEEKDVKWEQGEGSDMLIWDCLFALYYSVPLFYPIVSERAIYLVVNAQSSKKP